MRIKLAGASSRTVGISFWSMSFWSMSAVIHQWAVPTHTFVTRPPV